MPTYEYECQKCGAHLEVFQSITDKPLQRCKKCRGRLKRLIGTGAGIIFKGSGFYETDYRSHDYKKKAKAETSGSSSDSKSSDSSTKSTSESSKGGEKKTKKKDG